MKCAHQTYMRLQHARKYDLIKRVTACNCMHTQKVYNPHLKREIHTSTRISTCNNQPISRVECKPTIDKSPNLSVALALPVRTGPSEAQRRAHTSRLHLRCRGGLVLLKLHENRFLELVTICVLSGSNPSHKSCAHASFTLTYGVCI